MKPQEAPVVTAYALACVVVFILLTFTGFQTDAVIRAGFIPARFGSELIVPPGTMVPAALTPLTSAFLHGGWLHLIFNMIMLLFIGRQLEGPLGGKAMAVLLVIGAYAGALAQWAADPALTIPMIGASGAISALLAVYALIFSRTQDVRDRPDPRRTGSARCGSLRRGSGSSSSLGFAGGGGFRGGRDLGACGRLRRRVAARAASALAFGAR
jgi:membrane associated rhomboid family serine protease